MAAGIVPFAGIAFLWFMGVIGDRLGQLEDRFFSTIFLGSGLLFLALLFIWAGTASGLIASHTAHPEKIIETGIYAYGYEVMCAVSSVYVVRMAGVFMASLATIWIRTGTMPRPLAILTCGLSLAASQRWREPMGDADPSRLGAGRQHILPDSEHLEQQRLRIA